MKNETLDGVLVLASASARRRKILADLGVRFDMVSPPDDEMTDGSPADMVRVNAGRKLAWCRDVRPRCRILTADTVVVFDGKPLGKPGDISEAQEWFRAFSGRNQQVLTGVAYLDRLGMLREDIVESVVVFRRLNERVIGEYLGRVNPLDKAGGYDIDECGELIIERWEGSRTNIMGLPVELVASWFREDGIL
jgi:septum formation protein